jgi:hypothetical protein
MKTDAARLTERTFVLYYNQGKRYARSRISPRPLLNSFNRSCGTPINDHASKGRRLRCDGITGASRAVR